MENTSVHNPLFTVQALSGDVMRDTIVLEPLENGYGHTLGNALRRVLLSSLTGFAVTRLRIQGAEHQFSTVAGLTEDALDIALNVKQLRVRGSQQKTGTLRVSVTGPAQVTGADIDCEAGFEVINTDLVITTVAKGHVFEAELTVEMGTGYVIGEEKSTSVIGDIALDALFSPVAKVSYKVEQTRVGRRTDYDRLMLDVQTDGTLTPLEAVQQAAAILVKQFGQVVSPTTEKVEQVEESLSPEEAEVLRLTVEELDLPTRIANALRKGGFKTVGDLTGAPKDVVAKVKNLGGKSVVLIDAALQKKGVALGE